MHRFGYSSLALVLFALPGCGDGAMPDPYEPRYPEGYFSSGPDLVKARYFAASVMLDDGRVLVAGGADPSKTPWGASTSVEIFNPSTNQWSKGADMLLARFAHQAVLNDKGEVLVMGGQNNKVLSGPMTCNGASAFLCNTEIFASASGWSTGTKINMKYPRINFVAKAVQHGTRVIVGGGTAQQFPQSHEQFDTVAQTWNDIPAMENGIRIDHVGVTLPNDDVLLIGGSGKPLDGMDSPKPVAIVDRFDMKNQVWTTAGSIQIPRQSHTATALADGRVIITGGTEYANGDVLNNTEIFDPTTNSWAFGPPMNEKRSGHAATLLTGNRRLLVVGGINFMDGAPVLLESAEILDLETMIWTKLDTPLARHWLPSVHVLPSDGRVLIFGGAELDQDKITPLATTTLFTPPCASHLECVPGYRCGVDRVCIQDDVQSN